MKLTKKPAVDVVALVSELIKISSVSYHEATLVAYIESVLRTHGINSLVDAYSPSEYREGTPTTSTANLYVRFGSAPNPLVLYAHLDVVPGPQALFVPYVANGKLYGRGAADMKGALGSLLSVAISHHDALANLGRSVIFAFLADEESSGTGALRFVAWLREQHIEPYGCVLFEPSNDFSTIHVGGRGYEFLALTGPSSAVVQSLRSIISVRNSLIDRYLARNTQFKPSTITVTKVSMSSPARETVHEQIGLAAHSSSPELGTNAVEAVLSLQEDIAWLETGPADGVNSVPSRAYYVLGTQLDAEMTANVDIRTTVEASSCDSLLGDVRALIDPSVRVTVRDSGTAFLLKPGKLLDWCKASADTPPLEIIATGGSDAPPLFAATPNIIAGFGPGYLSVCHTDHEHVLLSQLEHCMRVAWNIISAYAKDPVSHE